MASNISTMLDRVDKDIEELDKAIAALPDAERLNCNGVENLAELMEAKASMIDARCQLISTEVRY